MTDALDTIYTADEAAERLRLTNRALIKIARRSGHCSRAGRDYLFSEADLLAIWQDMREPPTGNRRPSIVVPLPSPLGISEELRWLLGPPIKVDRRVIHILQWLEKQKEPKTYAQIDRCGPRTIDDLLAKGFVASVEMTKDGLHEVRITAEGKDQVRIYKRWQKKREARRRAGKRV